MDIVEAVLKRRSIREYQPKSVPREVLEEILEIARNSPSGKNLQPWRFFVVRKPELIEKFSKAARQTWISSAPVVLVCLGDLAIYRGKMSFSTLQSLLDMDLLSRSERWDIEVEENSIEKGVGDTLVCFLNVAIIIDEITLIALKYGLGTCWVRSFDVREVRKILDISPRYVVVALLALGYPAEEPKRRTRLSTLDLVLSWT